MVGARKISAAGRGLLVLGAAVLLISLVPLPWFNVPWFTVAGTRPEFPEGTYNGFQSTELLNSLANGPYAFVAYAWLFVCAIVAIAVAATGRPTHNVGTSGILVLLLYAILLIVGANLFNQQGTPSDAAVSFAYGFVAAVAGPILIEAGGRLPSPVPTKPRVPAADVGREKA